MTIGLPMLTLDEWVVDECEGVGLDMETEEWRPLEGMAEEDAARRADDYVREALEALSGASPTEEAPAL